MKTVIRAFFNIGFFFPICMCFGQATNSQPIELTAKNIKKLFRIKSTSCCPVQPMEWTTCFDTDSTYQTIDTVRLYADKYYYMTAHCCYKTSWIFRNKRTFTLTNTKLCQEPPLSSLRPDDGDLKVKFKKKDHQLMMSVSKQGELRDKFIILSIDDVELGKDKYVKRLTMVRKKENRRKH